MGVIRLVFLIGTVADAARAVPPEAVAVAAGLLFLDFGLPAILLFILAGRVARGRIWAAYAVMVLAGLELFALVFYLISQTGDSLAVGLLILTLPLLLVVKLPTLYLAASCMQALPELRHFRRSQLRDQPTHAFPVIVKPHAQSSMAAARLPPRPALNRHKPR